MGGVPKIWRRRREQVSDRGILFYLSHKQLLGEGNGNGEFNLISSTGAEDLGNFPLHSGALAAISWLFSLLLGASVTTSSS